MPNQDTIDVTRKHVISAVTIPKATGAQNTTVKLGEVWLENVEAFFAPGHVALTGFRINYGGATILPWAQPTSFLYGDNERLQYPTDLYVSGPLTIVTHNADNVSHLILFTFRYRERTLNELGAGAAPLPTVIV